MNNDEKKDEFAVPEAAYRVPTCIEIVMRLEIDHLMFYAVALYVIASDNCLIALYCVLFRLSKV